MILKLWYLIIHNLFLSKRLKTPINAMILMKKYFWIVFYNHKGSKRRNDPTVYTCIATWAFVWILFGSPLSLPQLHLTVWPATSVLCVATIAWAADSLVENLKLFSILEPTSHHSFHTKMSFNGPYWSLSFISGTIWCNFWIVKTFKLIPFILFNFYGRCSETFHSNQPHIVEREIFSTYH